MSKMFESTEINGMELANRFVRSATWEGMAANDGSVTPKLVATMTELARGGVGLIISGHSYVLPEGQAAPWQLGVYKDELIPGLREMTKAVHDCGGKIVMQLSHAGMFAPEKLTGQLPLVVSDLEEPGKKPYREITAQDIREIVTAFADGARRAKAAGFDGVQIHSAHGYLLSQFLSPVYNRRRDEYGGDIQNRARIHIEVYQAIREVVGENYPVLIKLNCKDFVENGLSLEDSLQVGRMLADVGLDAIELSGGLLTGGKLSPSRPGIKSEKEEAYFREEARDFKEAIGIPLILVGGMRSFQVAETLVKDGVADYISMSRPLIREPNLINRWKSGDFSKAECKSDNMCFRAGMSGNGVCCAMKGCEEIVG
ncbi:NADH:flavin oxidoreductase [Desulfallas sp. Bu1-1]|uniref:NADH:flavin oxidoreductase n=1 Tax=Desulfallas sp. Bu1-1 TaxID=2787620 RepID=UPI0018A0962F|nr:NADH:flavin oxidoreductase [Desulfallas sp. Bu1-1]MBF7084182.1 NADH:flavin oxidoreductase [Desulfallas sp. Bu1-1]